VIDPNGNPLVLKQLPTASILKDVYSVITAGNYINLNILLKEIETTQIDDDKLIIDPFAVIISNQDLETEQNNGLKESIGSTGSGIGAAVSRRINRDKSLQFAKDEPLLKKYLNYTTPFLRKLLDQNHRIIIEGTQGFGLSLLHSNNYPFTTSRDTSAAAFVSEAGLSPLDVDDVIMVIRTFPIRVGGNSGPLPNEIDWEAVTKISQRIEPLIEYTSVTNKVRRVATFDPNVVKHAIEVNNPTKIVLNHVDYLDCYSENGVISEKALLEIETIENLINKKIDFIGLDRMRVHLKNVLISKNILTV
jgi:adenylosuccinate synthase